MPNDQFDIKMIYPTIPSASDVPKSWFIKDGFQNDKRVRLDESVSGNGNDGYRLNDNSKVRFTVAADSQDAETDCDNDFTKSTSRGYVYKPNDWMGKANTGVEMTAYFKMSSIDQSDSSVKGNPIIMKGPTGEHHSNTDCCSGSAHMVHIGGEGEDWENNIALRLSKEMWHVHYITRSDYKTIGINESFLDMGWVGFKYIIYKKTIDSVKSVVIEVWIDENATKQSWRKLTNISTTDSGGWGDGGDDCNGNKDDRLAFGGARMMFRWDHRDGNDLKFKWISIRPIDPSGTFDESPEEPDTNEPTTTTFRSTLRLMRNINSDTGVGCGITGNVTYFEIKRTLNLISRDISNTPEDDYRSRVAQRANPSGGSSMVPEIPTEVQFSLRKNGTPAGTCRAKIWNSSGTQLYQSVNTITCTTLPSSFDGTMQVFDFSTNTHAMANGDRIGVEYTGTDPNNTISIECRDPGDGSTGSYYAWYDDNINAWDDITGRDVVIIVKKAIS